IIDTAGIRTHSENSIELLGQERSKEAAQKADLIIWVLDGSRPLDKNDKEIADFIKQSKLGIPIIEVLNKSDLLQQREGRREKGGSNSNDTSSLILPASSLSLNVSSKTGSGIPELLDAIAKIAGISETNDYLMITSRHFDLLKKAQGALEKAKEQYALQDADEISAFELRNALSAYENILGITTPHDILDTIFSTFCIGK
ncbi:MAG: 50S ribosome-binding GTPase, partial [Endomicrobia bacterium]|nr:50S ribosome-binding GTPase [Endomicrobiia bacterium]